MDPRLELVRIAQLRDAAPGKYESVLQRVLGEARVAQDPLGNRVKAVADLAHQDGERLTVSPAGLLHEVSIHLDLPIAATHGRGLPLMTVGCRANVQPNQLKVRGADQPGNKGETIPKIGRSPDGTSLPPPYVRDIAKTNDRDATTRGKLR